jgi:hypothetical protein
VSLFDENDHAADGALVTPIVGGVDPLSRFDDDLIGL